MRGAHVRELTPLQGVIGIIAVTVGLALEVGIGWGLVALGTALLFAAWSAS